MRRRSYVTLWAVLFALTVGGPVFLFVALVTPTRTGFLVAEAVTLAGAILGGLVGWHDHVRRWAKVRLVVRVRRELGFEYRAKVPPKELEPFRSLHLFQSHRHIPATDWMQGFWHGESVLLFDFVISGGSQATRTAGQAVVLFPESAAGFPVFHLRPRNPLRDFLGDDVSFDAAAVEEGEQRQSIERFTKSYVVVSQDEAGVRHHFTASVLHVLADQTGWVIESDGRHLMVMRAEDTPLGERPAYLEKAFALRTALLEAKTELPDEDELLLAGAAPPLVIPGKERGTGYRVAQVVWRVSAALGSAAILGGLIALKFVRRGNLLVAARNGALIGLGLAVAVVLLLGLFVAGKLLFTHLFPVRQAEQEEFT